VPLHGYAQISKGYLNNPRRWGVLSPSQIAVVVANIHSVMMRALLPLLLLSLAAGCSKPPSVDTFTAAPLSSACVALRSPNGQRQAFLVRFGVRWQGHVDDSFASTSRAVFAIAEGGAVPSLVYPADPGEPPVDLDGWKPLTNLPLLVIEAWAAGDPALRALEPSSIVGMIRIPGDSPAAFAVSASLAGELSGAALLPAPTGEALDDPGTIASRVAIEAAALAVADEDTGRTSPLGKMAILQIPVFLNDRWLAVEHFTFEDHGGPGGGLATSRFSLHDLETGDLFDPDALLDSVVLAKLAQWSALHSGRADTPKVPSAWHPSRPGVVLVYHAGVIAPVERGAVRLVVPWREVLPMLPSVSPLREIAGSIH